MRVCKVYRARGWSEQQFQCCNCKSVPIADVTVSMHWLTLWQLCFPAQCGRDRGYGSRDALAIAPASAALSWNTVVAASAPAHLDDKSPVVSQVGNASQAAQPSWKRLSGSSAKLETPLRQLSRPSSVALLGCPRMLDLSCSHSATSCLSVAIQTKPVYSQRQNVIHAGLGKLIGSLAFITALGQP